jgi:phage baseplate assembly protein V
MSIDVLGDLLGEKSPQKRIHGVVVGVVTNNQDPDGLGRVKLSFPWLSDAYESNWARVAAPMAGKERGAYFLPEVDDEVLVAFEHGVVERPFVVGTLWNGQDKPPADSNTVHVIKSKTGHVITLDDTQGQESVSIVDSSGKNSVVIDTANNNVTISADQNISLSAPNGTITLSATKIVIDASDEGQVRTGNGGLTMHADGDVFVSGKTVNLN